MGLLALKFLVGTIFLTSIQTSESSSSEEFQSFDLNPFERNPNHCNRTILACETHECCKSECFSRNDPDNTVCLTDCLDDCFNYNVQKVNVKVEVVQPPKTAAVIELDNNHLGNEIEVLNTQRERCCYIDVPQNCTQIPFPPWFHCTTKRRTTTCGDHCDNNGIEIQSTLHDDITTTEVPRSTFPPPTPAYNLPREVINPYYYYFRGTPSYYPNSWWVQPQYPYPIINPYPYIPYPMIYQYPIILYPIQYPPQFYFQYPNNCGSFQPERPYYPPTNPPPRTSQTTVTTQEPISTTEMTKQAPELMSSTTESKVEVLTTTTELPIQTSAVTNVVTVVPVTITTTKDETGTMGEDETTFEGESSGDYDGVSTEDEDYDLEVPAEDYLR